MYSLDFRWRIVSLLHIYDLEITFLSEIFGPKPPTIFRWYQLFQTTGTVVENAGNPVWQSRWPPEVLASVENYCAIHPTFYLEELQEFLERTFPNLDNISIPTIC